MDTATLRQHMSKTLSDEDLQILAYDQFRQVYEGYTTGQSKGERIHALIEWADRHGELARLAGLLGLIEQADSPPRQPLDSKSCVDLLEARARLNTLLDIAEIMDKMPEWLRQMIQREHDIIHDLKLKIMRL
jgi:hypothetical protein